MVKQEVKIKLSFFGWLVFLGLVATGFAEAAIEKSDPSLSSRLKQILSSQYPSARIIFRAEPVWVQGSPPKKIEKVVFQSDRQGQADFLVSGTFLSVPRQGVVRIAFSAPAPTLFALRRIKPRTVLAADMFEVREIDLALGKARQMKGLILPSTRNLGQLETLQTILEGRFPLLSGVQRVPDIRRGQTVKVKVLSGGLSLSAQAKMQESGYFGDQLPAITLKTKKRVRGRLLKDQSLEVRL